MPRSYDTVCVVIDPWPRVPVVHWHGWWDRTLASSEASTGILFTACGRPVGNRVSAAHCQELTKNALQYGRLCQRCAAKGPWPGQ